MTFTGFYKSQKPAQPPISSNFSAWRDLTSSYDIVGPYYTSAATVEAKFVVACCVFETLKLFQHHGIRMGVLVSDGGSTNIATIKASHGCHAAYSVKENGDDRFEVEPWMINQPL